MFCTKCGAQVTSGAGKFCTSCGAPLPAAASPAGAAQAGGSGVSPAQPVPPAAAPSAPAAGAKPSSPWAKVLIAVLGVFVFLSIAVMGTCAYVGYRMKKKVEEAKSEYGLDKIGSMVPNAQPGAGSPAQERDVCSLLSKDEVSEITGVTITKVSGSNSQCTYGSDTNPVVVQDTVNWQGGAMGFKMMVASMKMTSGGAPVIKSIPGIGDEAVTVTLPEDEKQDIKSSMKSAPMLKDMMNLMGQFPLMFRKGDIGVQVGVSESRDPDEAKKALAEKIASRL